MPKHKLHEYTNLRANLAEKLADIEEKGQDRLIFVGPPLVKEFMESVIKERQLKLFLVTHFNNWKELKQIDTESFDLALLFADNSDGVRKISEAIGISRERLLPLW